MSVNTPQTSSTQHHKYIISCMQVAIPISLFLNACRNRQKQLCYYNSLKHTCGNRQKYKIMMVTHTYIHAYINSLIRALPCNYIDSFLIFNGKQEKDLAVKCGILDSRLHYFSSRDQILYSIAMVEPCMLIMALVKNYLD